MRHLLLAATHPVLHSNSDTAEMVASSWSIDYVKVTPSGLFVYRKSARGTFTMWSSIPVVSRFFLLVALWPPCCMCARCAYPHPSMTDVLYIIWLCFCHAVVMDCDYACLLCVTCPRHEACARAQIYKSTWQRTWNMTNAATWTVSLFLAMRSGSRKSAFISSAKLKIILYWLLEPLQGLQRVCTW